MAISASHEYRHANGSIAIGGMARISACGSRQSVGSGLDATRRNRIVPTIVRTAEMTSIAWLAIATKFARRTKSGVGSGELLTPQTSSQRFNRYQHQYAPSPAPMSTRARRPDPTAFGHTTIRRTTAAQLTVTIAHHTDQPTRFAASANSRR